MLSYTVRSLFFAACGSLIALAPAMAQEAKSWGWIEVTNLDIYSLADPGTDGDFRFYNDERNLRGVVWVGVDSVSNYGGGQSRTTVVFTKDPNLPSSSDSLTDSSASSYVKVNGAYIEAGAEALLPDRYATGFGSVSTTATEDAGPGFYNLILAPHTGVVIEANSFVEAWVNDRCLVTCGSAYVSAGLQLVFGPNVDAFPNPPTFLDSVNFLKMDAGDFPGTGNLVHDSRGMTLSLTYENETDFEVIGRLRWDTDVEVMAAVPEPATWATLAAGLFLLALRRRRRSQG